MTQDDLQQQLILHLSLTMASINAFAIFFIINYAIIIKN